jgi:predicted nucleic acid-binding protein
VFELLQSGQIQAVVSTISVVEVLTAPFKEENAPLLLEYQRFFREAANLDTIPLDSRIAERAAAGRARFGLATPDAIVAATALDSGCEVLLTNDEDLKLVDGQGFRVLLIKDYL